MKIKIHRVSLGLLALMTLGGCASFNDSYYEKTQKVRAFKEYVHCGKPECSEYPHDYKKGWIDGFYEVATGGSDCPPAVAPARYYKPKEILKYCDKKRHDYYSGWQDGATRATQFPNTHYLRIYETNECPFPSCDKPCGSGQNGPCREAFVGMTATTQMIEAAPTPAPTLSTPLRSDDDTNEIIEDVDLPSGLNDDFEFDQDSAVNLTTPAGRAVTSSSVNTPLNTMQGAADRSQSTPTVSLLTDIPTLPMIPPPPQPDAVSVPVEPAEDAPLVSIPGYRATSEWNRPAVRPAKAQAVGFIQLVEPVQDAQATRSKSEGAEPIIVVEAPYRHFQMSDTETENKPVVKLVE